MLVSIFNDVIGPVMRGPSSSHCAAALRIGRLARDLMGGPIQDVRVEFDRQGSLATTHESQGSDMGLFGGLLGWDAADERLPESAEAIQRSGVRVRIAIVDSHDPHPNTYRLTLHNAQEQHSLVGISTGGGMVEITAIDAFAVSIAGDYFETLLWVPENAHRIVARLAGLVQADEIFVHQSAAGQLVEVKAQQFLSDAAITTLGEVAPVRRIRRLSPVLPVLSRKGITLPFKTCREMLRHDADGNTPLWKLAVAYERSRSNLGEEAIIAKMVEIVRIVRRAVAEGIAGTHYGDRVLGWQSGVLKVRMDAGQLLGGSALNRIVLYVSALMEVKSSMGIIVAAPTAGACAALPGACIAMADEMNLSDEVAARALLAGGMIGTFIAGQWTFAAEVGGCQAECGAAASMAAAALVTLAEGTLGQAVAAASMALQNMLGLICDPVANRVEVPCLGKNVMAASNALVCANMAMAGYDPVVPLDEVIETAKRVGESMPCALRCTALGGLSVTDTSREIGRRLAECRAQSPPAGS
jgi:L-serine dehydratase